MVALTAPRKIESVGRPGLHQQLGIVAGVACLMGGMAMQQGGSVRPARAGQGGNDLAKIADAATARVVGLFADTLTGGASDGAKAIDIDAGTFLLSNSAGVDAIDASHVGKHCFVVDDQTVAGNSAGGTRPIAGIVAAIDSNGVLVTISPEVAANARRTVFLQFAINETDTLAPTPAELVSPVSGVITRLTTIVQKAVTTGGDVTVKLDTTDVAGLVCTIADGALKGSVVTDTPTAGDATRNVAAGQRIQILPAAAFNTAGAISGVLEISF